MPYPLEIFDSEIVLGDGDAVTIPLTTGANYYNGDIRVVFFTASLPLDAGDVTFDFGIPAPWSLEFEDVPTQSSGSHLRGMWVYTLALDEDSEDDVITCLPSPGAQLGWWAYMAITLHNWNSVADSPHTALVTNDGPFTPIDMSALTATGPGVVFGFTYTNQLGSPLPAGYTGIKDSGNSGAHYIPEDGSSGGQIWGKAISAAGSTGSTKMTLTQATHWSAAQIFLPTNPDVTTNLTFAGSAETDTANAVTLSKLGTTTMLIGTAVEEVDTAGQIFTPLTGYRISNPILLPGDPISASNISWVEPTMAKGSSVTVDTSIDNGATWQRATNGGPIPGLLKGNTSARTVLHRVTLTRALVTDPTPRCPKIDVRIAADSAKPEMVPLGLFTVNETTVYETGGPSGGRYLEIAGSDLSRTISRRTWEDIYFVDAHTDYAEAIRGIIENRLPGTQFNFASTEHKTPRLVFGTEQGNDPWQDAQDLATAIGYEVYFDPRGVCTLRPIPDPTVSNVVWEFTDGDKPTISALTRTITDETTFNYVVVQGEGTANAVPVQAIAEDDDPASPTYVNGPYGRIPTYFTTPMITTEEQAQNAADGLLRAVKGASENVELSVITNPALEPGDVAKSSVMDAKVAGTFMINQLTIPFVASNLMTATVYRQS